MFVSAFKVVILDHKATSALAKEKNIFKEGFFFIALSALASGVGVLLFPRARYGGVVLYRPDLLNTLGTVLLSFVVTALALYVISWLAEEVFKGKLNHKSLFGVLAYAQVVGLIALVPRLAVLGMLWSLVVLAMVLHREAKLSWVSIAVLLIASVVILAVLGGILGAGVGLAGAGF